MDIIERIYSQVLPKQDPLATQDVDQVRSKQKIRYEITTSKNVFPLFGFDQLCETNNCNRLQYLELKTFNLNEDTKGLRVIRELRF